MFQAVVRIIIAHNGSILLLKRSDSSARFPGAYELPGGKVNDGEDIEAALKRELIEETGTSFDDYNIFKALSYSSEESNIIMVVYYASVSKTYKPKVSKEHTGYIWQNIDTLNNINQTNELAKILAILLERKMVNNTTQKTEVKLYTDGGSRGNPGPSALGYVIFDMEDNVVEKGSKYLGITTNNQAEYQAVKEGLEACKSLKVQAVNVFLDSQLVANQMNGIYKIKNRDLWPIHQSIKELSKLFSDGVNFTYVPRSLNKDADEMVNLELDAVEKNNKSKL